MPWPVLWIGVIEAYIHELSSFKITKITIRHITHMMFDGDIDGWYIVVESCNPSYAFLILHSYQLTSYVDICEIILKSILHFPCVVPMLPMFHPVNINNYNDSN